MKICSGCKLLKPLLDFHRNKTRRDGFEHRCRVCRKSLAAEFYLKNKDAISARVEKWKAKNLLRSIEIEKAWRIKNAERISKRRSEQYRKDIENQRLIKRDRRRIDCRTEAGKAREKAYNKKNPGKRAAFSARRRSLLLKATPAWARDEWNEFVIAETYTLAAERSKTTGVEHSVDHIVPLKSQFVSGLHCAANLQVLEARQNLKKRNFKWPNMPNSALQPPQR